MEAVAILRREEEKGGKNLSFSFTDKSTTPSSLLPFPRIHRLRGLSAPRRTQRQQPPQRGRRARR
jgi:hypothetical protein